MNPLRQRIAKFIGGNGNQQVKNELVNIVDPANSGFRSLGGHRSSVSKDICIDNLDPDESYFGMVFAAVQRRAVAVADYILENMETQRNGVAVVVERKDDNHPYINLLKKNPEFSFYELLQLTSIMLDLTGDSFLGVNRGVRNLKAGGVQVFKTKGFDPLRSYYVTPKVDLDNNLVHWEYRKPKSHIKVTYLPEQMIHIKEVSPFEEILGFGLLDAAQVSAYLDREASEHTAGALKNNLSVAGVLDLDNSVDADVWQNFQQSVDDKYTGKRGSGKPILSNGSGVSFTEMRYDLNKMALETIKNLSREEINAVFGVSKTLLGIEQSGVTRESSKVQRELFNENHVKPRARKIIEALNRDYARFSGKFTTLEIGFKEDADPEKEILKHQSEAVKLDNARKYYELGVSREYIQREVLKIEEENIFDHEPVFNKEQEVVLAPRTQSAEKTTNKVAKESFNDVIQNGFKPAQYNLIIDAQDQLRKDVQKWQKSYLSMYLKSLTATNELDTKQENDLIEDLAKAMSAFNNSIYPLMLKQHGQDNANRFAKKYVETLVKPAHKSSITKRANIIARSHNQTVADQLERLIINAEENGYTRSRVAKEVRDLFANKINTAQATRIAVTETSHAYNETRHIENLDFINRHELQSAKYVWRVNSSNPDAVCQALNGTEIPVEGKYYRPGGSVTAVSSDGKEVKLSTWEHSTGRPPVHPNCMCSVDLQL